MATTIQQSLEQVSKLVKQFSTNRTYYSAPGYKEADVRQEFVDPLFIALGWDVHNTQGAAPYYREVIFESSLDAEGEKRTPDYVFRVGRESKFFAEAKKPGVSIKTDSAPAYQLRSYAWSAKLPFSILTDFEEFAVYDCRSKPLQKDKASSGRVSFYDFNEYVDLWPKIWDIFSRPAVLGGSFDQFVELEKTKRGTNGVDVEFLKEIEAWRTILARNIALRNPRISISDLNDAVQRTIDRIIFLRMAEDRGTETWGQLRSIGERSDIYRRLVGLYDDADNKYNSGLFDFSSKGDTLTSDLKIDDSVLKSVIGDLYFPQSPYQFNLLPLDILGQVYEQFLGKVIHLTPSHQARIEEKPEVKKSGGVVYTPTFIVDRIVTDTVAKLVEGKTPREVSRLRILDMGCGSGTFLLGAYGYLLDWHLHWYTEHEPEKHKKEVYLTPAGYRLTTAEKKRILLNNLYGVDIDRQAVEVTKLSLLLKVLEGEDEETLGKQLSLLKERALPNLDQNIKCGNSLVSPNYFASRLIPDEAELQRVNPFDWEREFPEVMKRGGFDCIIGNPPYIRIQVMTEWAPLEVEIYKELYQVARFGNYDIYVVFVEKALSLLNKNGRLGFILPSKFFATDYGETLRKIIVNGEHLAKVVNFGHAQVFENATTYTCLLFLTARPTKNVEYVRVDSPRSPTSASAQERTFKSETFTEKPWGFSTDKENEIAGKLLQHSVPLGDLPTRIGRGSSSGADEVFILHRNGTTLVTKLGNQVEIEPGILRVPIYATDFGRYRFNPHSDQVIIFPYNVSENSYELKTETEMRHEYPKALKYLSSRRKDLDERKQFKDWYSFSAPRNLDVHDSAQMLVPLLANKGLYCYLPKEKAGFCLMASGGFSLTVGTKPELSPSYVLGLLNSRLLFWRLHSISNIFRGGWITCTKQYVETLPIHLIDFSDPTDKSRHDRIVAFVERMLDLHKRLHDAESDSEREMLHRQINSTDSNIDKLVYELYELTEEEVKVVEGDEQ